MRSLLIAALLLMIGFAPEAMSQERDRIAIKHPRGAPLAAGQLYHVSFSCHPRTAAAVGLEALGSLEALETFFARFTPFGDTSETFGFYLFKGMPTAAGNSTFAAADNIDGAVHVMTVDRSSTSVGFGNTRCEGSFIVNGSVNSTIMAFLSTSKTAQTEALAKTATLISTTVGPLFSLVNGGKMLDLVQQQTVADASTVLTNYSNFLAVFDNSKSESEVIPLREGHATIGVDAVSVEIDIVPVDDLLIARGIPFRDSLAKILSSDDNIGDAIDDEAALPRKCTSIAAEWINAGLSSELDQAYVLWRTLASSSPSKAQLVQCLGSRRATAALPHLRLFRLPEELKFDEKDIRNYADDPSANDEFGQQPQGWADLPNVATQLGRDMTRLGRGTALPRGGEDLWALFADNLKVIDDTEDYFVRAAITPKGTDNVFVGAPEEILPKLTAIGFKRWGCFLETDGSSDFKSSANEALVMVATQAESAPRRPVVVRVFFTDFRIAGLLLTDSPRPDDLISAVGKCSLAAPQVVTAAATAQ